ncbi:UNVERIFIED_CONTAM: hypothetical protein FKN15_037408 [Acipenser sinensis]
MQQVLDNLNELPTTTGAKEIDLIFLRGIMESPIVRSLAKAHERLEDVKLEAVRDNNMELVTEILDDIIPLTSKDDDAAELARILKEPHFQAHDTVASKCYEAPPSNSEIKNDVAANNQQIVPADSVRMIGIRKKAGEPLGVTFRVENGDLVIARILHGGMIDRQGLLHVGDVIKELNGRGVSLLVKSCNFTAILLANVVKWKLVMLEEGPLDLFQVSFLKKRGKHLSEETGIIQGVTFRVENGDLVIARILHGGMIDRQGLLHVGDVIKELNGRGVGNNPKELQEMLRNSSGGITLKILPSYKDSPVPQQACHARGGTTGLIPSQFLEEKRKAFVRRDWDNSGILCGTIGGKKKKKMMYLTARNAEFDRHELQIYEEVARMPPFQRKMLVLIGAQGVGRRSLKNRLIVFNPTRFGTTIPFTSRRPRDDERDGQAYRFVSRVEMEADIKASRYLEHGEYEGNLYGTKIDSIHEVVDTGRTCILDVNPQALKVLKTSEFMPYVVFIAAPELETLRAMHKAVVDAGITSKLLTGVTFRVENGDLVIARILHGGMIDRQGLLHVGDVIKELNGRGVGNNPKELQEMLRNSSGGITLKILPSYKDSPVPQQIYLKSHFDYNPAIDNLIPCKEAGLKFARGDIMQIMNREDCNWWQACHARGGTTGLIPSQFLEEKRKAFVRRDWDNSGILCGTIGGKKKKKMMYLTARNAEFDRHELQIYEEVARMPPFQRKTLVLIGAQGVGRRSLKNRLIVFNPTRFGTTIPFTSRRPRDDERDGQAYRFVSRVEMEADIKASRYLEHGEYEGNLYGTKIDSIHEVVDTGRTCILDVNPQALKVLKTSEFMPYVVFIAAPELETLRAMHKAVVDAGITSKLLTDMDLKKTVDESARIKRAYNHYFDLTIVNDNLDKAFEKLQAAVDKLCVEPQWVPVNWVY